MRKQPSENSSRSVGATLTVLLGDDGRTLMCGREGQPVASRGSCLCAGEGTCGRLCHCCLQLDSRARVGTDRRSVFIFFHHHHHHRRRQQQQQHIPQTPNYCPFSCLYFLDLHRNHLCHYSGYLKSPSTRPAGFTDFEGGSLTGGKRLFQFPPCASSF